MYTEDYENRGFPFRDFLLKLILIIIFVFLLVWLLPKFIKPVTVENKDTIKEISAISSQIFQNNLDNAHPAEPQGGRKSPSAECLRPHAP